MSLSNYLKNVFLLSVWRWWYLNIYSIFVRSYLFHSYVYCRRTKNAVQYYLKSFMCFFFLFLLLTLWLYSSLNKKEIWLKMCGDRLKDKQEDRHVLKNKMNQFLTQHDPHHYYFPFPCFHINAKHICIYSTPWNMTIHYPVTWSYVCINNTTMITRKK